MLTMRIKSPPHFFPAARWGTAGVFKRSREENRHSQGPVWWAKMTWTRLKDEQANFCFWKRWTRTNSLQQKCYVFQFLKLSLPGCWTSRELTYLTYLTQRCFLKMWVFLFISVISVGIVQFKSYSCSPHLFSCRALWWLRWILASLITFWLSSSRRHWNNI